MTIVRSILAVLAGLVFVVIASFVTDMTLLHSLFRTMNTPQVIAPLRWAITRSTASSADGSLPGWPPGDRSCTP
jgi:hypothetical protein